MDFVADLLSVQGEAETGGGWDLLQSLNGTGALQGLGQVVAVDLFIGNNDRFEVAGPNIGQVVIQGNILFRKTQFGLIEAVGLDWFSAGNAEESALHAAPPPDWSGMLLNDDARLRTFSEAAIGSLNKYFSKMLFKHVNENDLIGRAGVGLFHAGLLHGKEDLKNYLRHKQAQGDGKEPPLGVRQRAERLGWSLGQLGGFVGMGGFQQKQGYFRTTRG